jgi:hypothetical protein
MERVSVSGSGKPVEEINTPSAGMDSLIGNCVTWGLLFCTVLLGLRNEVEMGGRLACMGKEMCRPK